MPPESSARMHGQRGICPRRDSRRTPAPAGSTGPAWPPASGSAAGPPSRRRIAAESPPRIPFSAARRPRRVGRRAGDPEPDSCAMVCSGLPEPLIFASQTRDQNSTWYFWVILRRISAVAAMISARMAWTSVAASPSLRPGRPGVRPGCPGPRPAGCRPCTRRYPPYIP